MAAVLIDPWIEAEPAPIREVRAAVRAYAAEQLDAGAFVPRVDSWLSGFSAEFSRALGARGWLGMTWPKRFGGHERSELERYAVIEELLVAGAPVAAHWMADRQIGRSILKHGTDAQCERFLPAIARGECYFSLGMSEPDSGSDLASVRTRATRTAGGWQLRGTKVWTSHAHRAHYAVVLARSAPQDTNDRHAGLSQFIVDLKAGGVQVNPVRYLDGEHHFNEVVLDDVTVPDEMLLGAEGAGWAQVTAELGYERSGPERFLSTMPLLLGLIRQAGDAGEIQIGGLLAELLALRTLSRSVAAALQRGDEPVVDAALVKDLGTRFEGRVIDVARSVLPVLPDLEATEAYPRHLAEAVLHAPGFTLRGGTNEILRSIVARALVAR